MQVNEAVKMLKRKEGKIKWKDLEELDAEKDLKKNLDCTCPSCDRVNMSCLKSVVPKLEVIYEKVVMHKAYWCKIWEIDAPPKR